MLEQLRDELVQSSNLNNGHPHAEQQPQTPKQCDENTRDNQGESDELPTDPPCDESTSSIEPTRSDAAPPEVTPLEVDPSEAAQPDATNTVAENRDDYINTLITQVRMQDVRPAHSKTRVIHKPGKSQATSRGIQLSKQTSIKSGLLNTWVKRKLSPEKDADTVNITKQSRGESTVK